MKKLFLIFLLALCGCEVKIHEVDFNIATKSCTANGGLVYYTKKADPWRSIVEANCKDGTTVKTIYTPKDSDARTP